MTECKIRSAYSHREPVNNPVSDSPPKSPTRQEFKKEVNINEIVARMRKGIQPPAWMTSNTPRYGDFSNMPTSFQEAYAIIESGEAAFKSLPLEFRRALDHNPANLPNAPRELYEEFGLLKTPENPETASGGNSSLSKASPSSRPAGGPNAPSGANKAVKKPANDADE